jgi:hypothetical protein
MLRPLLQPVALKECSGLILGRLSVDQQCSPLWEWDVLSVLQLKVLKRQ